MRYIVLPVKRDPVEAEETMWEVMRQGFPGIAPSDGDPLTGLFRSAGVLYSETAELATKMAAEGFRYFGRALAGILPVDEHLATGAVTFSSIDPAPPTGLLVPEGTQVSGRGQGGEPVGFRSVTAAVIPPGASEVSTAVEAMLEGVGGNDVTGDAELVEYIDYLQGVATFDAPTGGGTDREPDEDHLDRVATELQIMRPSPVLPRDFEILARRFAGPGYRATAIDGLDPVANTTGNERMVALSVIDSAGEEADPAAMTRVRTGLEAMRELTFSVPTFAPTHTEIDAAFTATAYPGVDKVAAETAGIARLVDFLSPDRYGIREDTGEDVEWINHPVIRYLEAAAQLDRVEGIDQITSLTINVAGNPAGTADIALTGYAPLPRPGNITGSVV